MDKTLDLKLIPEYDGSAKQSIAEWLEKVELVCKLRGIRDIASVIPLRLTGGAFAVYLQLADEERKNPEKVKCALLAAFAVDSFDAYEEFVARKLEAEEAPDVYLADLRRLASLFGGVSDKALICAFVTGLPGSLRRLLKAGSRMEDLSLSEILSRVRAIVKDERPMSVKDVCFGASDSRVQSRQGMSKRRCFACGGLNHFARDCSLRRQGSSVGKKGKTPASTSQAQEYRRKGSNAVVAKHQGNECGEELSAPASSPRH
uniref:CCHC-type domain-containing protein n=1 Tax=Trichuris muris TaxID=70415 RepID=A0A5S6QCD6_TRIMR